MEFEGEKEGITETSFKVTSFKSEPKALKFISKKEVLNNPIVVKIVECSKQILKGKGKASKPYEVYTFVVRCDDYTDKRLDNVFAGNTDFIGNYDTEFIKVESVKSSTKFDPETKEPYLDWLITGVRK